MLILAPDRRLRVLGLLVAGVGVGLNGPLLLPDGDRVWLGAGFAAATAAAVVLAVVFRRWPWVFGFLALLTAPIRVPVEFGAADANLLVPLYLVLAGGALVLLYELLRDPPRVRELGIFALPLSAFAAWLAATTFWADNHRDAAVDYVFFVVPFALLALLVARLPWNRSALRGAFGLLIAMAVAFAGVGIYQWITKEIWWNPKVQVFNAVKNPFRVNSVFWDPSIYGRFLVIAILAALIIVLLKPERREAIVLMALIPVMWIGLLFSFSQSSFAALVVGTAVVALFAWRWRALIAIAAVALVAVPVVALAPQFDDVRASLQGEDGGFNRLTGGRWDQATSGIDVARANPALGVALGGYLDAYAEQAGLTRAPDRQAQHAAPVTIAAEAGLPGVVLFLVLVLVGLAAPLLAARGDPAAQPVAFVAGIAFVVIVVHSLFYSAFFEDPLMWGAVGLAALGLANRKTVPALSLQHATREPLRSIHPRRPLVEPQA